MGKDPKDCGHQNYTVDPVTGEWTCKDCGALLIDCLGRVLK